MRIAVFLVCALAAAFNAAAAQPLRCVIEPERATEVGSPVIGVIESIHVERGDYVKQGQVLARLRATVEQASVGAAQVKAQAQADVQAALANFEFQRQKLARTEELMQKKFVSAQALDQVRAETAVAEQRFAQTKEQSRLARQELESANAQLALRSIRAPFSGIIADRYMNVGERVEVKPMFRVVKIDVLRVEIIAPAALYGTVQNGMAAQITPELPNAAKLDAKIVLVDRLIDAASNTFRVRAELPNSKGTVPSGSRCRAELPGVADTAQAATPAPRQDAPVQPAAQPAKAAAAAQAVPAQPQKTAALPNQPAAQPQKTAATGPLPVTLNPRQ